MWQTVERKARFIAQVMRGRLDVREIEDIGDAALSYNEVKALATGNPLLMDKAEADAELTRLERAERAHRRNRDTLRHKITSAEKRVLSLTALTSDIDATIGRRRDTRGDAFTMTLDGVAYSKRSHAGVRVMQFLEREITALTRSSHLRIEARPGQLGGFDVTTATSRVLGTIQVTLALDGVPESEIRLTAKDLADTDPAGLVVRLENRLTGLEAIKTRTLGEIDRLGAEAARTREDASKPFTQAGQLAAARERARQIEQQLNEAARPHQPGETHQLTGVATSEATESAVVQGATGEYVVAAELNGAGVLATANGVNGTPTGQAYAEPAIPGPHVSTGTTGRRPPEAARIAQHSFPEHQPFVGSAEPGTSAASQAALRPDRSAHRTMNPRR